MLKALVKWFARKYLTPSEILTLGIHGNKLNGIDSANAIEQLIDRKYYVLSQSVRDEIMNKILRIQQRRSIYSTEDDFLHGLVFDSTTSDRLLEQLINRIVFEEEEKDDSLIYNMYQFTWSQIYVGALLVSGSNHLKRKAEINKVVKNYLPKITNERAQLLTDLIIYMHNKPED